MKKAIALMLSILMAVLVIVPVQSFAQAQNVNELEEVIKAVKRKIDIPDGLKFYDYYVSTDEKGEKTWNLSWRDEDNDTGMSVGITSKGVITRYYYYEPYKQPENKFPKVSEEKALEIAEDFIRRVAPAGTLTKIKKHEQYTYQILYLLYNYSFTYYRVANGIPYYANNVIVNVNSETGKVESYYYNLDDSLSFPSLDNVMPLEDAQQAYEKNLGLKLIYKYYYDYRDKKLNIYPVYLPKYDNSLYAVDAVTGDKVRTGSYYYGYSNGTAVSVTYKEMLMDAAGGISEPVLTPEELEAARKQAEFLTEGEAESIVRGVPEIGLDDEYKLTNVYLSKSYPENDKYVYSLSFSKEVKGESEKDTRYYYASVSLNAQTGEIISFYNDSYYSEDYYKMEPKYDKDAAKAEVEKFLSDFNQAKFAETLLDEGEDGDIIILESSEKQRYYYFHYTRQVNGIPFPDNYIRVGFDAVIGKVTNYNMRWFDVEFPGLENVITEQDAYKSLFEKIGLELQYKNIYRQNNEVIPLIEPVTKTGEAVVVEKAATDDGEVIVVIDDKADEINVIPDITLSLPQNGTSQVMPVYALKEGKPFFLDAYTGNLLDYDGKLFKELKPEEYTDIEGHFAEEKIKTLAKYGIINFSGPEYRPNDSITQKDFMIILYRVKYGYYGRTLDEEDQNTINEIYKFLIRDGIIRESEKAPESAVTREDAVKFIIRTLNYGEVAEIPGIFIVPFEDGDDISPELKGYVAIASGLKIVSGSAGKFNPKNELTRAEAAVMIYNYLSNR